MIIKKITFGKEMTDENYTSFINLAESQGVFHSCGNPDEKWVCLKFENDIDYMAWGVAMGIFEMREGE